MLQLKRWIGIKNHPIGVEDLVLGLKECETLSHTQQPQQQQSPKTHKKKSTIRLAIITIFCAPPKVASLPVLSLV